MPTKPGQLSFRDLIELYAALVRLDGYEKAVGDKVIFSPYKFTDDVRRRIVKNRRILKPLNEDFEELRLTIVKEVADDGTSFVDPLDDRKQEEYREKHRQLLKVKHDVPALETFTRDELFVDGRNPIPGSVEEPLWLILTDAQTREPAEVETEV